MHVKDALLLRRRLLTVIALVLLIPSFSYGQAVIKVNDNISLRFGALIQAWAGQKSFVRKGTTPPPPDDPGNPTVNFHGEKLSNATHA